MDSHKLSGSVEWYEIQKGYGVIKGDDGNKYFVRFDDDLDEIEYALMMKPRVRFRPGPREKGEGLQAYDVEVAEPPQSPQKGASILEHVHYFNEHSHEIIALREQESIRVRKWNLWKDVKNEYSEFQEGFDQISIQTGLKQVPVEKKVVKRVFYDDIPSGAWPRDYSRVMDIEKRMGAHTKFQDETVNLIVHAFYRNAKHDVICWRARAFRRFRGKVFSMSKSWRMSFGEFLTDISYMIRKCRRS